MLELLVLQRAKNIIRRRRGNECHYNMGQHGSMSVHRVVKTQPDLDRNFPDVAQYSQGPIYPHINETSEGNFMGTILRSILHKKLVQRRQNFAHSPYSRTGKGGSGDKPKPKPQPIEPGKKSPVHIDVR